LTVARTFWGEAWCENLERYSDFANRLPRGRTYVRNGSVVDLRIAPGAVTALVSGSDLYEVEMLLFLLRKVNHQDLVVKAGSDLSRAKKVRVWRVLDARDLSEIFGIEMAGHAPPAPSTRVRTQKTRVSSKAAVRRH
jgi:uncharacterized Zn finger protein